VDKDYDAEVFLYCVDKNGIKEIDYYAPYAKETIEEKIRRMASQKRKMK